MANEASVKIYRGESLEAVHEIAVAVVDAEGNLTHYVGEPSVTFMARSSIKPFQLMPLILSGAADKFTFSSEQLAVMSGSHSGTDRHVAVIKSNLERAGNGPEHLKCGCHWPIWMQADGIYPEHGEDREPIRHNCSGKHSGFLAQARFLDDAIEAYLNPQSQTQRMVRETIGSYCEFDLSQVSPGIDGCSAPNYPLPVRRLALGFKKLAAGEGADGAIRQAAVRVRDAIQAHPFMVSGDKRFDYDLMRSFPGKVVCKIGAEAIEGIGFKNPSIGICVKVIDGNTRALGPACVEVLKQLGLIAEMESVPFLKAHERPVILNNRDLETGRIVVDFRLKKA